MRNPGNGIVNTQAKLRSHKFCINKQFFAPGRDLLVVVCTMENDSTDSDEEVEEVPKVKEEKKVVKKKAKRRR